MRQSLLAATAIVTALFIAVWELVNVVAACTASECVWWAYFKRPA